MFQKNVFARPCSTTKRANTRRTLLSSTENPSAREVDVRRQEDDPEHQAAAEERQSVEEPRRLASDVGDHHLVRPIEDDGDLDTRLEGASVHFEASGVLHVAPRHVLEVSVVTEDFLLDACPCTLSRVRIALVCGMVNGSLHLSLMVGVCTSKTHSPKDSKQYYI